MINSLLNKFELDTPCLTLDLDILESNLHKMQVAATRAGKQLRPHAKTHKCSILAKNQMAAGAVGICVAKVSEAEALVNRDLQNILITGPVATERKIARMVDLLSRAPNLMVAIDRPESVTMLADLLHARWMSMDVLLDLDVGLHRTGVAPSAAMDLARLILTRPELRLKGIQAYAGQVQHIQSYEERKKASLACLQEAAGVFRQLQSITDTCSIFSASGTGTFDIDLEIPELTDMQVGSYVCMDTEYLSIGSAADPNQFSAFTPALRLLTSVISCNQAGFVTVDAGLKSLYRDGGVPRLFGEQAAGLAYSWFGDEYGRITSTNGGELPALGSVLELVTSHCDPTINLFDRFYLVRDDHVVGIWPIDLRGCSQ